MVIVVVGGSNIGSKRNGCSGRIGDVVVLW